MADITTCFIISSYWSFESKIDLQIDHVLDIWSKIDLQIDHVLDFWGENHSPNRSFTRFFALVIDLSSVCDASTKLSGLQMHTTLIDLDGPLFPAWHAFVSVDLQSDRRTANQRHLHP